ncbi:hypothetical protein M3182_04285 [Mesobacillus maritimus]|uniref:hypothetical protein n=1 Tax=Mesobacillus maritimus TaxID=1643336 RepID=UPI00203E489F|nr:hypothetical protein [Mesobacillus maritimus]MCM3584964.1 hypothetical protein [Mesobacillus maritimus]
MEACTTSDTMTPMSGGQDLATMVVGKPGHMCFMGCRIMIAMLEHGSSLAIGPMYRVEGIGTTAP